MVAPDPGPINLAGHWDSVYERAEPTQLSWHQTEPTVSMELIKALNLGKGAAIIDVGGGTSTLVDVLVAEGYRDVTVLDASRHAIDATRGRIGARADAVTWMVEDLLTWEPARRFDLWHDRAVFHFFVEAPDRTRYRELLHRALQPGGYVVVGTFAPEGPTRCSGLAVSRYDPQDVLEVLGADFDLINSRQETHTTPAGHSQPFSWAVLRTTSRTRTSPSAPEQRSAVGGREPSS
jgi:SAM-dependent methyltransferase